MQRSNRSMLAASLRCAAMLIAGLSVMPLANAFAIRSLESSTAYRGASTATDLHTFGTWNFSVRDRSSVVDNLFGVDAEGPIPATIGVATGRVGKSFGSRNSLRFSLTDFKVHSGNGALHLRVAAGEIGMHQSSVKSANASPTGTIEPPGAESGSISVAEPGTLALFGLGLTALGLLMRRRKSY